MSLTPKAGMRPLGTSDLHVSPIAYGYWRFAGTDVQTATKKVQTALEAGINLMDHADIYGLDGDGAFGDAEVLFGEVLKQSPQIREQIVLATKGGILPPLPYDSSKAYLRTALEASLRRLGVERIDLYQIHRPDFLAHPAEVAEALTAFRREGKIGEVGVSNYTTAQVRALQAHLDFPLVSRQPEFSVLAIDPLRDGTLDQCMEQTLTPLAWSPMGGGKLGLSLEAAKQVDQTGRVANVLATLDDIASEQGVSRASVALAWVMVHPAGVIPILGTQRCERILESRQAF
ncbi:MAG: aldo/keto reductase, partial [Bradymonadia bacterium]